MAEFTSDQKRHIDDRIKEYMSECSNDVKKEFYNKLKLPLIGLAGLFAIAVSIFATYLYMQAKINVMQAQTEFAAVKKDFYEDAMEARKQIDEMVATYNGLAENAQASVKRMQGYEATLEAIARNYTEMTSNTPANNQPTTQPEAIPPTSHNDAGMPPPLVQQSSRPARDMFQIPQRQPGQLR